MAALDRGNEAIQKQDTRLYLKAAYDLLKPIATIDNINFSQRDDLVRYGASGLARNWKMRQQLRSKRFTTPSPR